MFKITLDAIKDFHARNLTSGVDGRAIEGWERKWQNTIEKSSDRATACKEMRKIRKLLCLPV